MRRIPLVVLLALALTSSMVMGDPLYKWVDQQGNVHYSDKPQPGAKKLKLAPASTFTAPVPGEAPGATDSDHQFSDDQASGSDKQKAAYTEFKIASPQANEVLWNVTSVTVTVSVQPGFQSGDKVTITLDGKVVESDTGTATFDDLERGEHSVSANLQAADGTVMVAQPITFFIQRGTKKGF